MTNFYFIRHAHTALNKGNMFQGGQTNSKLDEIGQKQLSESVTAIRAKLPESYLLVSSPLNRAQQTVAGLELDQTHEVIDNRVRERDFGVWEGQTVTDVRKDYPQELDRYFNNDPEVIPPKGESMQVVAKRMLSAIDEFSKSQYSDVVIVSHGISIVIGLSALLEGPNYFENILDIPKNVSLAKVSLDDTADLQYYNQTFY